MYISKYDINIYYYIHVFIIIVVAITTSLPPRDRLTGDNNQGISPVGQIWYVLSAYLVFLSSAGGR